MKMAEAPGKNGSSQRMPADPVWCGVGSPRPQPRVKFGGMFGHVEDAFDEKTLPVGQTDYRGRSLNGNKKQEEKKEEEEKEEDKAEEEPEVVEQGRVGPLPVSEAVSTITPSYF